MQVGNGVAKVVVTELKVSEFWLASSFRQPGAATPSSLARRFRNLSQAQPRRDLSLASRAMGQLMKPNGDIPNMMRLCKSALTPLCLSPESWQMLTSCLLRSVLIFCFSCSISTRVLVLEDMVTADKSQARSAAATDLHWLQGSSVAVLSAA